MFLSSERSEPLILKRSTELPGEMDPHLDEQSVVVDDPVKCPMRGLALFTVRLLIKSKRFTCCPLGGPKDKCPSDLPFPPDELRAPPLGPTTRLLSICQLIFSGVSCRSPERPVSCGVSRLCASPLNFANVAESQ